MRKLLDYLDELKARPYLTVIIGLFISSIFLVLFSKIVWETIYENNVHHFDSAVIALIRFPAGPKLDAFMMAVTELGSGTLLTIITISVLLFFTLKKWKRETTALLICLVGAALLTQLLKELFARARPDMFSLVNESGYSFPSGHSMVSFCVYGFLAYVLSRQFTSIRCRMAAFFAAACVVLIIGVSRVYLGVHYPTDVLAGFVAGGTWLAFCLSWLHWREYRKGLR